jgi:hypothetical protein
LVGIFWIIGYYFVSLISNCTFKKLEGLCSYSISSAIYVNTSSYLNFTIDRCIFAELKSTHHSALGGSFQSSFIRCTRTRFEDNSGGYNPDIGITVVCSNYPPKEHLYAFSCSTSEPEETRVCCEWSYIPGLLKNCSSEVVLFLYISF